MPTYVKYDPKTWETGEAITKEWMQHIEDGIAAASEELADGTYSKTQVNDLLSPISSNASTALTNSTTALETARQAILDARDGQEALSQIQAVYPGLNEMGELISNKYVSLKDRLVKDKEELEDSIDDLSSAHITLAEQVSSTNFEVEQARGNIHWSTGGVNQKAESLKQRVDDLDYQINLNQKASAGAVADLNSAKGSAYNSVSDRLDAIDGGTFHSTSMSADISALQTEVSDARGRDGSGNLNTALSQRFTQDEALINARVKYTDVKDDLTLTDTDKPLSANKGRELKGMIDTLNNTMGGNYSNQSTVADAISTAEQNAKTYADNQIAANNTAIFASEIGNAHRENGDTLDDRFDDIETAISHQADAQNNDPGGLTERLEVVEEDINGNGGIIERLDALDDASTGAIKALQDADDALDQRLDALDTAETGAIALLQQADTALDGRLDAIDGGSALDTTNGTLSARVAAAETKISHTKDENDENDKGGLEQRMDAAETAIATKADASAMQAALNEKANASTVESALALKADASTVETALAGKASASSVSDLTATVNGLLNRDTIVVSYDGEHSNYINNIPNIPSADIWPNADYLIADDEGKYFYWRLINDSWELISGAVSEGGGNSGGGTSSGVIVSQLPETIQADENTDYFVGDNTNGYLHYRFTTIDNVKQAILIGPNFSAIKTYNITKITKGDKNYLRLFEYEYGEANIIDNELNVNDWVSGTEYAAEDLVIYQDYVYKCVTANSDAEWTSNKWEKYSNIRIVNTIELPAGGGGGTIATDKIITRISSRSSKQSISSNDKVYLRFFYTSGAANESDNYTLTHSNATTPAYILKSDTIDSGDPEDMARVWPTKEVQQEIDGEIQTVVVPKEQAECPVGFYAIDVTEACKTLGKQTFTLTISDIDNPNLYTTMIWEVTVINLAMTSDFPQNTIVDLNENIEFTYVPEGGVEKTAYFYIGDTLIGSESLSARTVDEQTYTIPGKSVEGAYLLKARLGTTDGSKTIYSDYIYRDLIWRNESSENIILSSPYRGRTVEMKQYNAIEIPYTIAGPNSSYTVQYFIDDMEHPYNEISLVNKNSEVWTYRPYERGTKHLRIKVSNVYIDITIEVQANTVDIAPYTTNLVLDFNPSGLSNNSEMAKNWTNGTYHLTTSENFDWQNGGYGSDNTGEYFLIKSGTRAYFDYKMFMQDSEEITSQDNQTVTIPTSKVYKTGQEMKLIFKTSAVRAIDAVWFTNMAKYDANVDTEVGIQLSAHEGCLKTDTAGVVVGDDEAVTNTYLYFPYSEEDRIELDININKEDSANGVITMSYEDGVPSKAYAYTHNQKLYHVPNNEAVITIGSDDCDVYIYKLKIYNQELTPAQVLRNFIADGKDVDESIRRYERNCIYYDVEHDVYSPYATSGFELNPEAIASKIPNVKVLMLDTPTFTKNKKSFIKDSSLRCIHADGGTIYKSRGAADNWLFENGYHAGQGTTSDKYGDSGRNIDFLFNCDGSHKPSDKVNAIEGYKSQVTIGYGTENAVTSVVENWMGPENEGKVSLTSTSIPNNFFNFKVNIASSENVNNAMLQKRYNDFLPYLSPAKNRDSRIKNDMEFVPAILFVRENSDNLVDHMEFGDTNWHFYALGNLGDSKKTDYTRAYDPTDMNEFTLEISDNNTNNSQFQTGVYMVNGQPTLEEFEIVQDTEDDGITLIEDSYTAQGRSGAIATTDYVYPLDTPALKALWNATDPQTGEYTNKNHWSLVNEPYDGDHSFEMRYACQGNYRDGKLVNDTHGKITVNGSEVSKDKYQLEVNARVWQAFYSWVVTASNSEFVQNLDQWCVRSAVEFWYAFTHYYTMMDNRAKNTFWHFGKTGKHRRVIEPLKDMLHTYDESADASLEDDGSYSGTFTPTEDTEVNSNKTYYTEYAFDLWDYDNDTALGINNNGELIFPYGKEDSDYTIADNPASGYVFNGAGSVFWRRLRDLCTSEISSIFNTVREEFFSAENLIDQFDNFQNCYPEALWQVDIQRKYIRPFIKDMGKNLPNDGHEFLTRKDENFLKTMMQGRKKYQRRQWIRDQYYYFGSKYKLNNITEDFFLMDCWTGPDDALIAELKAQGRDEEAAQYVGSNWDITITPYQDMYINASFGETAKTPVRAKAGQPVEMVCPFTSMNNTRIYIYGASRLSALAGKAKREDPNDPNKITGADGLASLYFGYNRLQKADKLQHLYIGTDKTTYRNANLVDLSLNENSPILETLDIRNCSYLTGELKVGGCNNLRVLKAEGTNINLVTLPASSQITTLSIPATVTNVSLTSARKLTSFKIIDKTTGLEDYTKLTSLFVDHSDTSSNVNWLSIAESSLDNLSYLYLLNLETSSIVNINELEDFVNKKQALEDASETATVLLSGNITVTGEWSTNEKEYYEGIWPITIVPGPDAVNWPSYPVIYKYDNYTDDNNNTVVGTEITRIYVKSGNPITDIYYDGTWPTMPTRTSTARNSYQFGSRRYGSYVEFSGWKVSGDSQPISSLQQIPTVGNSEMTIETYFNKSTRTYPIRWFMSADADDRYKVDETASGVEYEGGEDQSAPTIKDIHDKGFATYTYSIDNGIVTYDIFKGWDSLPINIHPGVNDTYYDIHAVWEHDMISLNNLFNDTSNLTPAQLMIYSHLNSDQRQQYVGNKVDRKLRTVQTLGYESLETPTTTLYDGNSILRLDVYNPVKTTVQPMRAGDDAFTIVIDYCFNKNWLENRNSNTYANKTAAIVAGCYYKNSTAEILNGFGLYYNFDNTLGAIGPRVGFGDMFSDSAYSCPVGNANNADCRNIVVLRHPKGSEYLYVYSHLGNSNGITDEVYSNRLEWNASTSDAFLNFGRMTDSTSDEYRNLNNSITKAGATIYYAKYWNKDLGLGECKQLASWPHENTTFAISGISNNTSSGGPQNKNSIPSPSIGLTTLTSSNCGRLIFNNSLGWGDSNLRTISNSRVFNGLPTTLQAIVNNPAIDYYNVKASTNQWNMTTYVKDSGQTSSQRDYVHMLSVNNFTQNSDYTNETNSMNYEDAPFSWLNNSVGITVYEYVSNNNWNTVVSDDSAKYQNLRFAIKPFSNNFRVFKIASSATDPTSTTPLYTLARQKGAVQQGDIFIKPDGTAYMYVKNEDILGLGIQVENNSGVFTVPDEENGQEIGGGWVQAKDYWLRSMMFNTTSIGCAFVLQTGDVVVDNTMSPDSRGLSLNYSIAI